MNILTAEKEHFIMMKVTVHQKNIILNIYAFHNGLKICEEKPDRNENRNKQFRKNSWVYQYLHLTQWLDQLDKISVKSEELNNTVMVHTECQLEWIEGYSNALNLGVSVKGTPKEINI